MNLKKIGSILFHRTALVALFLLFQIGLLMVTIVRFSDYFIPIYLFCATVSLFVVLYIINKKGDPGYKIAWIIPIMLAPVFGGLVYLLCGASGLSKRDQKKMESMDRHLIEALDRDKKSGAVADFGWDAVNQSRYLDFGRTSEGGTLHLSGVLYYHPRKVLECDFGDFGGESGSGGRCAADL